MTTGFEYKNNVLQIAKTPMAELAYYLDWVDWLETGDSLQSVSFVIQARSNDPQPLVKEGEGIQGTKTFVQLKSGQRDKAYTVTANIETVNGLKDSRYFKVLVKERSA